jgi:hypothetical protein
VGGTGPRDRRAGVAARPRGVGIGLSAVSEESEAARFHLCRWLRNPPP